LHQLRGEPETARDLAASGVEIATENALPQYIYWTTIALHSATSDLGDGDAADKITGIRETIGALRAIGSNLLNPFWLVLLARAYAHNGQAEESLAALAEAFEEIERTEERWWEAELHRFKGQLLLESNDANTSEAEACFLKAIDIAQSQNAKSWELRAATSLARLWRDQGKPGDARDLLKPVHDWFTEGFETADLKDAKAELDELA
jgi:predicted ATPase